MQTSGAQKSACTLFITALVLHYGCAGAAAARVVGAAVAGLNPKPYDRAGAAAARLFSAAVAARPEGSSK